MEYGWVWPGRDTLLRFRYRPRLPFLQSLGRRLFRASDTMRTTLGPPVTACATTE